MSFLKVENIQFNYEEKEILKNFSLELKEGEFHSILGQSGCGKSTLLHIIAGFLSPSTGSVQLRDRELIGIPSEERNIGIVFQEHCLFPHMTVEKNIAYGLKKGSVEELLDLVKLSDKKNKFPDELSGGEQQRIAIARTLAANPCLLLLDEPFSSLDQSLREGLSHEIKEITEKLGLTTLMVTHSIEEAVDLSDRITLMKCDRSFETNTYKDISEVYDYLKRKRDQVEGYLN